MLESHSVLGSMGCIQNTKSHVADTVCVVTVGLYVPYALWQMDIASQLSQTRCSLLNSLADTLD